MSKIICIEGPVYSGKTTTIREIQRLIRNKKKSSIVLRSPGSTPKGERLRDILNDKDSNISHSRRREMFHEAHIELIEHIEWLERYRNYDYIILDRVAPISEIVHGAYHSIVSSDTDKLGKHTGVEYTMEAFDLIELYKDINGKRPLHVFALMPDENEYKSRIMERGTKEDKYFDHKPMEAKMDNYNKYRYMLSTYNAYKADGSIESGDEFVKEMVPGKVIEVNNTYLEPEEIAEIILTYAKNLF